MRPVHITAVLFVLLYTALCVAQEAVEQPEALEAKLANDEDLQNMSSAQLADLEKRALAEVDESKKQLEELRSQTSVLKREQKDITSQAEKLQGARDWEADEKRKREKELDEVKKGVELRQHKLAEMTAHVRGLKKQIDELRIHLSNLTAQKESVSKRYRSPSIADVFDAQSEQWSKTSQNVYRKTRDSLGPALNTFSHIAQVRRRVKSWPAFDVLASLLMYGFFVGAIVAAHKVYQRVRGHLTVPRLLFLGDTICACFWALMLLCYCFLWTDPLVTMQTRSPRLFFIYQLCALIAYTNFVFLRVLLLASRLSLSALGETLAVVVVGHHYYVRVWQPAVLDQPIHGTFFYYFCYAWLFLAFAYNRINEFAPLKQLRGEKLPPLVQLRVIFTRFFGEKVPDGDLESSPLIDDDEHES